MLADAPEKSMIESEKKKIRKHDMETQKEEHTAETPCNIDTQKEE